MAFTNQDSRPTRNNTNYGTDAPPALDNNPGPANLMPGQTGTPYAPGQNPFSDISTPKTLPLNPTPDTSNVNVPSINNNSNPLGYNNPNSMFNVQGGNSPYAQNFGGASSDPNVFTSGQYIKNLNQNAYARQSNQGLAPGFNQNQFDTAWNQYMQPGGNFNADAFNKSMGTQNVVGAGGPTALPQNEQARAEAARTALMQQQPQQPQQQPQIQPQTQAQAPQMQQQQQQANPWQQLMQSIFGGMGQSQGMGQGYGQNPSTQTLGNNGFGAQGFGGYGVNPFAMTGMMAPSMSNFNMGGGMYGNPMAGNYGNMGGVASLLNNVNQLRMGYGGMPGGYASPGYGQNPFQGFSPFFGQRGF